ncbi:hypothetical protein EKK58_01410 [Candidatus Dependentiae bacterium]|nr:MAG: hypothetical protein EKK58_01410 [Candidatus Dependentiae bacterium]
MAYTVPRVLIEQQFVAAPIFANNPLAAFIFGPNYRPLRYTVAAEKAYTYIGNYGDSGLSLTAYPWVAANPGAKVDISNSYANITPYLENAFAEYFRGQGISATGTLGSDTPFVVNGTYSSTDDYAVAVASSSGYFTNKIRSSSLSFAPGVNPTTGAVYPRQDYFSARDVQPGDWVAVTGLNGSAAKTTVFAQVVGVETDGNGKYNTLVTAQRIFDTDTGTTATLIDPTPGAGKFISIALYIRKSSVQMPVGFLLNTTSATQIAFQANSNANAKVTEAGLADSGGALKALTVKLPPAGASAYVSAKVYASYRVLRTDNATSIASLNDPALVEATLGAVVPENPLAEGVYDALLNSSGTPVYYMGVPTDDLAGYNAVLEQAKRVDTIYGLVPLTFDSTVLAAVKSHVETMSTAAEAKWRKAWISLQPTTFGVLQGYDRAAAGVNWTTGTSGADPQTGTSGVFATIAPASGSYDPALVTTGVRAGDTLRVFVDGTTTSSYTDYLISEVRSQNEVVTATAITGSGTRAVQVLRTYTNAEQVAALGAATGNSRRVNAVFPYIAKTAGVDKAGYFVAAALAGLRAGSLPHAPLTNVELLGFDDFTVSLVTFTPSQLNTLAAYGYWIVTQDVAGGTPYVRHQLTTLGYNDVGADPKFSEDSITTNVDSISYALQRALKPFIGRYNVNPATIALINSSLIRQFGALISVSSNTPAGPQLLSYEIKSIGKSTVFKDRIEAVVTVDLPYPLNGVTITLVVP